MQNDKTEAERSKAPLSIKRNMIWNSVGSYANLFAQWLITVAIVRISAGYDAAGVYGLAMAIYNMFQPVLHYKTYTVQVSDVDDENTPGEYLAFRGITCALGLSCVAVYAVVTCDPSLVPPVILYTVWKVVALLIDVVHGVMQKARRMDYMGKSLALQGLLTLVVFVTVFGLTQNLDLTLVCLAVATALEGLLYALPRARYFAKVTPGISWPKARHLLVYCAPVALGSIAAAAAPSLPRQYLMNAMGEAALGAYSTMAAPVAVIQMGANYIYNPLITYFSRSFKDKDAKAFYGLLVKTFLGMAAFGAVCAVGLELVGRPLLALVYGKSVLEYFYLMLPLIACAVITGLMWFANDLAVALREFRVTFWGSIVALLVSLATMVPAVAGFGLNGVTVANIASCAVSTLLIFVFLLRRLRKHFAEPAGPEKDA